MGSVCKTIVNFMCFIFPFYSYFDKVDSDLTIYARNNDAILDSCRQFLPMVGEET